MEGATHFIEHWVYEQYPSRTQSTGVIPIQHINYVLGNTKMGLGVKTVAVWYIKPKKK
jgi:hypothetical protein